MTTPVDLKPLVPKGRDLGDAALVAARAFHDDPFFEFLDANAVTRARGLALFWRAMIASAGSAAIITGARRPDDGRLLGLSVVVPPGHWPLSVPQQARQLAGAFRAMVIRPPALVKGTRYLLSMEAAHPKDHLWYLMLLVVDPSVQRGGIGSLLQQPMLRSADAEGVDCYLETQKQSNVPYYGRFGYELTQELKPVKDGPPLFLMRRAPQT
ncbi:MAG TPA: GNAT family N-acetyltransferase [Acidimicrobiales bacterium]|jgi:GNAT superfamily N-acetyltransferase|nr:GNAT family N-acetyltransferase [Acidimicrobiales bacterium]